MTSKETFLNLCTILFEKDESIQFHDPANIGLLDINAFSDYNLYYRGYNLTQVLEDLEIAAMLKPLLKDNYYQNENADYFDIMIMNKEDRRKIRKWLCKDDK